MTDEQLMQTFFGLLMILERNKGVQHFLFRKVGIGFRVPLRTLTNACELHSQGIVRGWNN